MSSYPPPPILLFNNTPTDKNNNNNSINVEDSIKTSILIIVLILSLTIILSLTLCLLLRHLNRRCLRLLSSSSSSTTTSSAAATTTTAATSSNRHSSHRVSPETVQHSVVDSLPLFTFGSIKRRSSSATTCDCAVCLNNFEAEDQLRLLPLCCHAFHAHCIDMWLHTNLTCPLCRSPIHASDSNLLKALSSATTNTADDVSRDSSGGSFRLEIGSVSRRREPDHEPRNSYSIGSFEYVMEEESEIMVSEMHRRTVSDKEIFGSVTEEDSVTAHQPSLAEEVASGGRSWLRECIDRLSHSVSSRTMSFRGSGRFFTGSSRRSESLPEEYDLEANRVGEEISEFFRWFSGV